MCLFSSLAQAETGGSETSPLVARLPEREDRRGSWDILTALMLAQSKNGEEANES